MFGWEKLSVQRVCLYVDPAANKRNLIRSIYSESIPAIIVTSELVDLTATAEDAARVMGYLSTGHRHVPSPEMVPNSGENGQQNKTWDVKLKIPLQVP